MSQAITVGNAHSLLHMPQLKCRHVPSGRTYNQKWSAAQHWMLGDPQGYAARTIMQVCHELVRKWNLQQPNTWFYWLEGSNEPTVG